MNELFARKIFFLFFILFFSHGAAVFIRRLVFANIPQSSNKSCHSQQDQYNNHRNDTSSDTGVQVLGFQIFVH